jgi:protein CpxP
MKSPITRAALIAGAAVSLMATATLAQAPAQTQPAHAMKRQHDPAEHAQRLREKLQLTPAQEPALQAFIASHQQMRADRESRKAEHAAEANLTTPQRLDRQASRKAQHDQRMAQRHDAVKRFYAALTPAQQKAFDAMHNEHKGKRGKRGGHGDHAQH